MGSSHSILPNGEIEYVINFQNTGTDTAINVKILDTLSLDLNVFSVAPGVSSHNYHFNIHGPRVLEWVFDDILLPDSMTNESESHGFVTFRVSQIPDLSNFTVINNVGNIYFDYNDPVITNQTEHTVNQDAQSITYQYINNLSIESCDTVYINNLSYSHSGDYYQLIDGGLNGDTLLNLHVEIKKNIFRIKYKFMYKLFMELKQSSISSKW